MSDFWFSGSRVNFDKEEREYLKKVEEICKEIEKKYESKGISVEYSVTKDVKKGVFGLGLKGINYKWDSSVSDAIFREIDEKMLVVDNVKE